MEGVRYLVCFKWRGNIAEHPIGLALYDEPPKTNTVCHTRWDNSSCVWFSINTMQSLFGHTRPRGSEWVKNSYMINDANRILWYKELDAKTTKEIESILLARDETYSDRIAAVPVADRHMRELRRLYPKRGTRLQCFFAAAREAAPLFEMEWVI